MTTARAVLAALLLAPTAAAGAARFAVVLGNDRGSAARQPLFFAEKDARGFRRTLVELGDFAEDRVTLLQGGGARELREALAAAEGKMALARSSGEKALLVVYYSGHAGAEGLELGSEVIGWEELRTLVGRSSAEAKVVIVDACESGGLTQVKGVKGATAAPALDFALPSEDSVRGTAFVASTAVGEAAQESAALGGSFFTHHLEVALRGAGDADGDGLVTLAEAFRYTSSQTVSGTAGTRAGPQHPTYEFKMSGRGDVVLADLRRAEARLALPPDPGTLYVLKGPKGLLAEVPGQAGRLSLALPAGRYAVERRAPEGRATASLTLARGESQDLPPLVPTRYEMARAKGGPMPGVLYAGAGVASMDLPGFGVAPFARIGLRQELGPVGLRVRFDTMGKSVTDQWLRYDFLYFAGAASVLFPLTASRFLLEAGPELGWGYATQRLPDRQSFASGVGWGGAAVMATYPLGPVRLGLDATVGAQAFKLNGDSVFRPAWSAGIILQLYGF
ncbi:MAG TPA: caspase family protein [Anaeromyxobacteraceae bacterium]|nr:caspase family protein [Anaeromyxobacteraceae bacterium]